MRTFLCCCLVLVLSSYAEGGTIFQALKSTARHAIDSVLHGRRTVTQVYPEAVMIVVRDRMNKIVGLCSGTLFEHGCVLTAGHCALDGKGYKTEIHMGNDPWNLIQQPNRKELMQEVTPPMARIGEMERLSDDPSDAGKDIALLKLHNPVLGIIPYKSMKDLPETKPKFEAEAGLKPQPGNVIGYGYHHTEEVTPEEPKAVLPGNRGPDPKLNGLTLGDLKDVGEGIMRVGELLPIGYAKFNPKKPKHQQDYKEQLNEEGDIIVTENSPHAGVGGDSGGPLLYRGKIAGIQSDASTLMTPAFELPKNPNGAWAGEVKNNAFASTWHHRDWIEKTSKKLGCGDNTLENSIAYVAGATKENFMKDDPNAAWEKFPEADKKRFLSELLRANAFSPDARPKVVGLTKKGGELFFDVDVTVDVVEDKKPIQKTYKKRFRLTGEFEPAQHFERG